MGPFTPLTMGRTAMGVLCNFLIKYNCCVRTSSGSVKCR